MSQVRIHQGLPGFKDDVHRVVTPGTFDGVHLGHAALLRWVKERAAALGGESVILTFDPHPRLVLFGADCGLELINTLEERLALLAEAGIDHVVVVPFDKAFSKMKPVEYVRSVLVDGLGVGTIVVGHDHRFGAGREGDVDLLGECSEAYGFDVQEIPAEIIDQITVSSTKVRRALQAGDVALGRKFLGRPFSLCGTVVRGAGIGRGLGFPTANLCVDSLWKLTPGEGVYAVTARLGDGVDAESWGGMCNIGRRPTVDEDGEVKIEVHLLIDEPQDLYGRPLMVDFYDRLRDEQKFESRQALVTQLEEDRHRALAALQKLGLKLAGLLALFLLVCTPELHAQTTESLSQSPPEWAWDTAQVYTDFEEALMRPELVVRLDLSRDRLRTLDARIVRFSALRELVLDRNKISALPEELRWVQTLERVSLSGNHLDHFPDILLKLSRLREVDLSDNEIEAIPMGIDRLQALEKLVLWGNILARFPATLSDIPGLRKLDLLHNEMTETEQEFLSTLLPKVSIEFSDPCRCNFDDDYNFESDRNRERTRDHE